MMAEPSLLLIDELSPGLMPIAADECYRVLSDLREDGLAILLVEQSTERVLHTADRIAILESGRLAWTGRGSEAIGDSAVADAILGLGESRNVRLQKRTGGSNSVRAEGGRYALSRRPAGRRARARSARRSAAAGCPPVPCDRRSAPARTAASSTPRP